MSKLGSSWHPERNIASPPLLGWLPIQAAILVWSALNFFESLELQQIREPGLSRLCRKADFMAPRKLVHEGYSCWQTKLSTSKNTVEACRSIMLARSFYIRSIRSVLGTGTLIAEPVWHARSMQKVICNATIVGIFWKLRSSRFSFHKAKRFHPRRPEEWSNLISRTWQMAASSTKEIAAIGAGWIMPKPGVASTKPVACSCAARFVGPEATA